MFLRVQKLCLGPTNVGTARGPKLGVEIPFCHRMRGVHFDGQRSVRTDCEHKSVKKAKSLTQFYSRRTATLPGRSPLFRPPPRLPPPSAVRRSCDQLEVLALANLPNSNVLPNCALLPSIPPRSRGMLNNVGGRLSSHGMVP